MSERSHLLSETAKRWPCILCEQRLAVPDSLYCQSCIDEINSNAAGRNALKTEEESMTDQLRDQSQAVGESGHSGLRLEFKLQDMWVGWFWKTEPTGAFRQYRTDLWVCILPCLPIHAWWTVTHGR